MTKLYLIRHAQSANNEIWNGSDHGDGRSSDPEITQNGQHQAATLGEHLAHPLGEPRRQPFNTEPETHFGLTHLYCSLMTRSIVTAEYIAGACDLDLHALPDIFERQGIFEAGDDGRLRGLPGPGRSYFEQRFPGLNLPDEFNDDGWWNRPVEDESSFKSRMQNVVKNFKQRHAGNDDCIAMIVHGDFIDQFVNELMGVVRHEHNYQSDWAANWTFHNTSISRIDFVGDSHNVVYLNRIDHLPAELVTW
jgi:2,3-bisphosphoglycerate-dependent phosphoglycerate mutase